MKIAPKRTSTPVTTQAKTPVPSFAAWVKANYGDNPNVDMETRRAAYEKFIATRDGAYTRSEGYVRPEGTARAPYPGYKGTKLKIRAR